MQKEDILEKDNVYLRLRSQFRNNFYSIHMNLTNQGWRIRYFGNFIDDEKDCCRLIEHLSSQEGTEFPQGSRAAFYQAWSDLQKGISLDEIQSNLNDFVNFSGRGKYASA